MKKYGILNEGINAWLFEDFSRHLSSVLNIGVVESPVDFNYVLSWGSEKWGERKIKACEKMFIPYEGIKNASDKRIQARLFNEKKIPTPKTYLFRDKEDIETILRDEKEKEWCIKWPTGCGASGHKIISSSEEIGEEWPSPVILQEFIRLDKPVVYRIYCAAGNLFGWNKRELEDDASPWVAHARGAKYVQLNNPNNQVINICRDTLRVIGIYESFGCVDLLQDRNGSWLVLEVGTDGIFNYVDRNLGISELEERIDKEISKAFYGYKS